MDQQQGPPTPPGYTQGQPPPPPPVDPEPPPPPPGYTEYSQAPPPREQAYYAPPAPPAKSGTDKGTVALILGVVGLLLVPILASIAALVVGYQVRNEAQVNPAVGDQGRAQWGIILGWVGLGLWALIIIGASGSSA